MKSDDLNLKKDIPEMYQNTFGYHGPAHKQQYFCFEMPGKRRFKGDSYFEVFKFHRLRNFLNSNAICNLKSNCLHKRPNSIWVIRSMARRCFIDCCHAKGGITFIPFLLKWFSPVLHFISIWQNCKTVGSEKHKHIIYVLVCFSDYTFLVIFNVLTVSQDKCWIGAKSVASYAATSRVKTSEDAGNSRLCASEGTGPPRPELTLIPTKNSEKISMNFHGITIPFYNYEIHS